VQLGQIEAGQVQNRADALHRLVHKDAHAARAS
jgi:hypothetical protein